MTTRQEALERLAALEDRVSILESKGDGEPEPQTSLAPPIVNPSTVIGTVYTDRFPIDILPDAGAESFDPSTLIAYIPAELTLPSGQKLREILRVWGGWRTKLSGVVQPEYYRLEHLGRLPKGAEGGWADDLNSSTYAIDEEGRILGKSKPVGYREWNVDLTDRYRFGRPIAFAPGFPLELDIPVERLRTLADEAESFESIAWLQLRPEDRDGPSRLQTIVAFGGDPYIALSGVDPYRWVRLESDGSQTMNGRPLGSLRFVMQREYPEDVFPIG